MSRPEPHRRGSGRPTSGVPRWIRWLVTRLARAGRADAVIGDLEEGHAVRRSRRGRLAAHLLTTLEGLDMVRALLLERLARVGAGVSWLDVKLGLRMMLKHPGITVLSTLAMAFAIFVGAGAFEFIAQVAYPTLPLPDGDRIVDVRLWDAGESRTERRVLYDLATWRRELTTIQDLGAFRSVERNLVTPEGRGEPLAMAAMDAEGFRVAGTPPLLGRLLVADDGRPGASPVMVIGYDVWVTRFRRDPGVVGTVVRLDSTPTTVVGVMPEGFGFPIAHQAWTPASLDAEAQAPREGPGVRVFGRLAPGASLADARSELDLLRSRMAAALPATHQHVRPEVRPWARGVMGMPPSISSLLVTAVGIASNIPLLLFLVLICGNVALLMFARAASRESELVVRSALGASRRRIVAQLFTEALLLALLAAALGLGAAQYGLAWLLRITRSIVLEGNPLPFWFHAGLSPATLIYTGLLAVVSAAVAGVLPGLKITRTLGRQLQRSGAGGGVRFGGVWTVVIVSQIAVTMLFPIFVLLTRAQRDRELVEDLDLASEQYLAARLKMTPVEGGPAPASPDETAAWLQDRFQPVARSLQERLNDEPRIAGVAFAERLPRQYHPWRQVEVDGPMPEPPDERGHRLSSAAVSIDYFDVMGARIVAGRGFQPADLEEGSRVVVVNRSFVQQILGGRNAVGEHVRYLASEEYRDPEQDPGPWLEIVGVVEDVGTRSGYGLQGMYHPMAVGEALPVHVVMRVNGDTRGVMPILRTVAAGVDPGLQLHDVITLDQVTQGQEEFFAFWTVVTGTVSGLAILLSLGAIFAVMSYAVSRRTREIGIRVALGSGRLRVVGAVFRRPMAQLVLGVLAGGALLTLLIVGSEARWPRMEELTVIGVYMLVAAGVCLTACVVPTVRALAVEPNDALRVEG